MWLICQKKRNGLDSQNGVVNAVEYSLRSCLVDSWWSSTLQLLWKNSQEGSDILRSTSPWNRRWAQWVFTNSSSHPCALSQTLFSLYWQSQTNSAAPSIDRTRNPSFLEKNPRNPDISPTQVRTLIIVYTCSTGGTRSRGWDDGDTCTRRWSFEGEWDGTGCRTWSSSA